VIFEAQLSDRFLYFLGPVFPWDTFDSRIVVNVLFNRHRFKDQIRLGAVADQFTGFLKLLGDIKPSNLNLA